ncbi:MAG: hypothetical protein Fues2KO_25410 [Fuerstiella sp.]
MSSSADPQFTQQATWRPGRKAAGQMKRRKLLAGLTLLSIAALLIAAFLYLVTNPLRSPGTELVLLSADNSQDSAPLPFAHADFEAIRTNAPMFRRSAHEPDRIRQTAALRTPDDLTKLAAECDRQLGSDSDVLMLYVRAFGTLVNGQPHLRWSFDRTWTQQRTLPLSDLLEMLSGRLCPTKLLVLDCGSESWHPEEALLVNDFVRAAGEQLRARNDASLWILTSRDDFQAAYYSRSLGQTVFGAAFADALSGRADRNEDGTLTLEELFKYTRSQTSEWVASRTARLLQQTPRLLHARRIDWRKTPAVLTMARRYRPPEQSAESDTPSAPETNSPTAAETTAAESTTTNPSAWLARHGVATILWPQSESLEQIEPPGDSAAVKTEPPPTEVPTSTDESATTPPVAGQPTESSSPAAEPSNEASPDGNSTGSDIDPAAAEATDGGAAPADAAGAWSPVINAWQQRDRLQESAISPKQFATHVWRDLQSELLKHQATLRFASEAGRKAAAADLQQLTVSLKSLHEIDAAAPEIVSQLGRMLQPRPLTDPIDSLSAQRVLHQLQLQPASPKALKTLAELQTALDAPDDQAIRQWLKDQKTSVSEVRFLRSLLSTDQPWSAIQTLVQLRLASEAAQSAAAISPSQFQPILERADRFRLEAELYVRFPVGPIEADRISQLAESAGSLYGYIQSAAGSYHDAQQLLLETLFEIPEQIHAERQRLMQQVHRTANRELLLRHLQSISQLLNLINAAGEIRPAQVQLLQEHVGRIQAERDQLRQMRDSTIARLPTSGPLSFVQELRVQRLLQSTLIDAATRERLLESLDRTNAQPRQPATRQAAYTEVTGPPQVYWDTVQHHARLELHRVQLIAQLMQDEHADALLHQEFEKAIERVESAAHSADRVAAWNQFAAELHAEHRRFANRLKDVDRREQYEFHSGDFLQVVGTLSLLNAPALDQLPVTENIRPLVIRNNSFQSALRDIAVKRLLLTRQDATSEERMVLDAELTRLGVRPPSDDLRMQLQNSVAMTSQSPQQISVVLTNHAASAKDVYLSVDYDAASIDVRSNPGFRIMNADVIRTEQSSKWKAAEVELKKSQFAADLANALPPDLPDQLRQLQELVQSGQYPLRPLQIAAVPTLTLKAGERRSVPLIVSPMRPTNAAERVIIRAQTTDNFLRHDLLLKTPPPRPVQPILIGAPGTVGSSADPIDAAERQLLQPFPNQSTAFALQLRNLTDDQLTADLTVIRAADSFEVPRSPITAAAADALLGPVRSQHVLATAQEIALPAADTVSVTLSAPQVALAADPNAADQTAPTSDAPAAPISPSASGKRFLSTGLLIRVDDRRSGQTSLFRIPIAVQHPRRFVQTQAAFDADSGEFKVQVTADDLQKLPPNDVRLALRFDPPNKTGAVRAVLNRSTPTVELSIQHPTLDGADRRPERVVLDVNGYPSTFAWRIPRSSVPAIAEDQSTLQIRIVAPEPGSSQTSAQQTVTTTLQIVAPPGFPNSPGQQLQVGIDRDRDRELHDEPVVDLSSARGVQVWWNGLSDSGQLQVGTQVGAATVEIPVAACRNQQANLLAKIVDHDTTVWSAPVPITFDDLQPQIQQVTLSPPEVQAIGQPINVQTIASDGDLSGVASSVVGVTTDGKSLAADIPPVALKQTPDGSWTGDFDTAALGPGQHRLAVQAKDHAGNISVLSDHSVLLVTPADAAKMAAAATNTIRGTITYGGQPVPNAMVAVLQPGVEPAAPADSADSEPPALPDPVSTDEFGNYVLPKVPVGQYTVQVTALVRGLNREKSAPVEVKAPPRQHRVDLDLR